MTMALILYPGVGSSLLTNLVICRNESLTLTSPLIDTLYRITSEDGKYWTFEQGKVRSIIHLSSSGSTFVAHARHSRKVTTNVCDISGQIFTWNGDAKRRGIEVVGAI